MNDRTLLELAAKAICRSLTIVYGQTTHYEIVTSAVTSEPWDPLTDDGDALRLANALDMSVEISSHEESTYCYAGNVPRVHAVENWNGDKSLATRRAIVRAAASIGKQMK